MRSFIKIAGFTAFFILFVFAFVFYKERAITFDMARQTFYYILTNNVVIANQRFGACIPQLLPLMLRWLNCPLKAILMASSLGLVGFYFSIFLVLTFIMRHYVAALIFLLSTLLLVNDTFYWIQSELPQALAWLVLYYAYIERKSIDDIRGRPVLHFALLLFIMFMHPLMIFPVLYLLLYLLYRQHKFNWSFYVWPIGIITIIFCIRLGLSKFNAYEGGRLDVIARLQHHKAALMELFNLERLVNWHTAPYLLAAPVLFAFVAWAIKRRLYAVIFLLAISGFAFCMYYLSLWPQLPSIALAVHLAKTDYLLYCLIFLLTIILLLRRSEFCQTSLLVLFTACYILLICLANRHADKFYLENLFLPLSIFLLLPFVELLINAEGNFQKPVLVLLTIIIAVRLIFIYDAHEPYSYRLFWYENKFEEMDRNHSQRLMLTEKDVPMDTLVMSWPSGYESVMLSSIDGPAHTKSIIIDTSLTEYKYCLKADTLLLAKWFVINETELPQNYFRMQRGNYEVP